MIITSIPDVSKLQKERESVAPFQKKCKKETSSHSSNKRKHSLVKSEIKYTPKRPVIKKGKVKQTVHGGSRAVLPNGRLAVMCL
jgi:hypothetical protein